jgi:hypothetical protein
MISLAMSGSWIPGPDKQTSYIVAEIDDSRSSLFGCALVSIRAGPHWQESLVQLYYCLPWRTAVEWTPAADFGQTQSQALPRLFRIVEHLYMVVRQ